MRLIIKITGLQILILSGLSSWAQDKHCIPLQESAAIHQMAYQKLLQDTILSEMEGQILVLQEQVVSTRESYAADLQAEQRKNDLLKQNARSYQQMNSSYEAETKYLKKRERKARRERNVAIGIGAILIVMAVVK